ncbi:MAG: DNA/RNA non-specific endonuclease [Flavobacterium sp.]|nr:MAG: DNA/RNA non-specific endonuclease [Flavobacterium sp.]
MSYVTHFLEVAEVAPPSISEREQEGFCEAGLQVDDYFLDYTNYSLLHNPLRFFPYYTAANIDGNLFKKISRKELFGGGGDAWKKDKRIPGEFQLGSELYSAKKSDFDKGHLTKREDVQWGDTDKKAKDAAESTFYFTNAMPQVDRLNRGIWRKIEDYILHQEVVEGHRKIILFTGPVFQDHDPEFVTEVKGSTIQLPYLFWKVVYYLKDGVLHRTAFLTSQLGLLKKRRIVKPTVRGGPEGVQKDAFLNFKDAETYQVSVGLIEKLGELVFTPAEEAYTDERPERLILKDVNVRSDGEIESVPNSINIKL